MARTTNEFGGGEIVPAIEAITGIQAPVMADFVAVPFGTVNHEHGERRQIQNLRNNLKSSSGIERIPFNGIDELDTEQGPNGETVYALNTGDSRIRFYGPQVSLVSNTNGTSVQTASSTIDGFLEFTFFGTGLNLLIDVGEVNPNPTLFAKIVVNGTTRATTDIPNFIQRGLLGVRNRKSNQVFPIVSGLSAAVHTVTITMSDSASLYGCEFINENAAITQQRGADFDGRVSALNGTSFPIKPLNTTIPSVNSRSGVLEALPMTATTGARVLNYLTSGGQYKQSFDIADEAPGASGASFTEYTIEIQTGSTTSVTIPSTSTSFIATTFGSGGGGAGGFASSFPSAVSGGGGGGAGKAAAIFTRTTSTQAETLALTIPGTAGAGSGFSSSGSDGGTATIITGGTTIASAPGGGGSAMPDFSNNSFEGAAGEIGTSQAFTGWTVGSQTDTVGTKGTAGEGASGDDAEFAGGDGGSVGGVGNSPLVSPEGNGGGGGGHTDDGGAGNTPGAGGGGGGTHSGGGNSTTGGVGAASRIYLVITDPSSTLTNTTFGITTGELTGTVTITGVSAGAPTAVFGNASFDANRLNQEVIRRINYSEFGANNQFAIGGNGVSAAFTLDDGTTTLVGSVLNTFTACVVQNGGFATLTFVGTGLDIYGEFTNINSTQVDGLSIGNFTDTQTGNVIVPIVSGLAYGTHTVRFSNSGNTGDIAIRDFIIYGPKKPEIPTLDAGSLELSDYNIMADYTQTVATGTADATGLGGYLTLGKGLLRKMSTQEFRYQGVYQSLTGFSSSSINGTQLETLNANNNHFYTFYGTGFDYRFGSVTGKNVTFFIDGANTGTITPIALDGTEVIGGNTISIDFYGTGSTVATVENFTARPIGSTGTEEVAFAAKTNGQLGINGAGTMNNAGIVIRNLPLGLHTVRVFVGGAGSSKYTPRAMDIITPIHFQNDNLKVGSEGLNNLTIDPIVEEDEQAVLNLGEAKAWINFDITTSSIINSSHNISAVIRASDSTARYYFDKPFKDSNYVVISTIFDTNNSPAATVLEQRANYVAINASLSGNEKQYIVCFGELIDE